MDALMWNRRYWLDASRFTAEELSNLLASVGFQVLDRMEHRFEPDGYTFLCLLGESHFALHTFPEHGVDYVELTSCNRELLTAFDRALLERASERGCRVHAVASPSTSTPTFA